MNAVNQLFPIPSVDEERATEMGGAADSWARHHLISKAERDAIRKQVPSPWRHYGPVLSILFFALTALGVAALFGFCLLLKVPKGMVTAVLCIATAEWLIRSGRFFRTGVEAALWLGGLLAIIFDLPGEPSVEALLLFAAAGAVAGYRVRSPLIGTASAILIVVYAGVKETSGWPAMLYASILALAAAAALGREWKRGSSETFFALLAVVMPVTGYVTARVTGTFDASGRQSLAITSLLLLDALVLLALGVRRRERVLLIAGAVALAAAAIENRSLFGWSLETQCIVAGLVLGAIGVALSRHLRDRVIGFVVTPVDTAEAMELAQIGGTLLVAHPTSTDATVERTGGGGGFGGGGASGGY